MGWGWKGLASAAAALSLCGLASCGGGSGAGDSQSGAVAFTPHHHDDSGGGSAQFITPGADNSVQEYGSEADAAEFEEIAAAFHNFLDARAEEKWAAACSYLAPSTARHYERLVASSGRVKGKSCAGILPIVMSRIPVAELREEAAQADVGAVRVKGQQAFVIYTGPGGSVAADSILKEHGVWRVGSIISTPLG
jgi:hypothetical protein